MERENIHLATNVLHDKRGTVILGHGIMKLFNRLFYNVEQDVKRKCYNAFIKRLAIQHIRIYSSNAHLAIYNMPLLCQITHDLFQCDQNEVKLAGVVIMMPFSWDSNRYKCAEL